MSFILFPETIEVNELDDSVTDWFLWLLFIDGLKSRVARVHDGDESFESDLDAEPCIDGLSEIFDAFLEHHDRMEDSNDRGGRKSILALEEEHEGKADKRSQISRHFCVSPIETPDQFELEICADFDLPDFLDHVLEGHLPRIEFDGPNALKQFGVCLDPAVLVNIDFDLILGFEFAHQELKTNGQCDQEDDYESHPLDAVENNRSDDSELNG